MPERTHQLFLGNLDRSMPSVWTVATWLSDRGNKVLATVPRKADRAHQKPYAFFCLNPPKTHAALVFGSSKNNWWVSSRHDRRYGLAQEFYVCRKDLPWFFAVGEILPWFLEGSTT